MRRIVWYDDFGSRFLLGRKPFFAGHSLRYCEPCSDEEKTMSRQRYPWRQMVASICAAGFLLANGYSTLMAFGGEHEERMAADGGGTTIIHGGTGAAGGFAPVITTVAFHAEQEGDTVAGFFDCLALAPEVAAGNGSGQFTKNVMYVVGAVTGMTIEGETAILTGKASITGLGAGSNVSFKFVVHKGGPGASSTLTVSTLTNSFDEILVQGSFQVSSQ